MRHWKKMILLMRTVLFRSVLIILRWNVLEVFLVKKMDRKWCILCLWQLEEQGEKNEAVTATLTQRRSAGFYPSFSCDVFASATAWLRLTSRPSQPCCWCWRSSTRAVVQANIPLYLALSAASIAPRWLYQDITAVFPSIVCLCFTRSEQWHSGSGGTSRNSTPSALF